MMQHSFHGSDEMQKLLGYSVHCKLQEERYNELTFSLHLYLD
jgi:hypothetical protein